MLQSPLQFFNIQILYAGNNPMKSAIIHPRIFTGRTTIMRMRRPMGMMRMRRPIKKKKV
jgi:hypothetical protein